MEKKTFESAKEKAYKGPEIYRVTEKGVKVKNRPRGKHMENVTIAQLEDGWHVLDESGSDWDGDPEPFPTYNYAMLFCKMNELNVVEAFFTEQNK